MLLRPHNEAEQSWGAGGKTGESPSVSRGPAAQRAQCPSCQRSRGRHRFCTGAAGKVLGPGRGFVPPGLSQVLPAVPRAPPVCSPLAAAARRGDPLGADAFGGGQGAATPGWGAPRDLGTRAGGTVKPPAAPG